MVGWPGAHLCGAPNPAQPRALAPANTSTVQAAACSHSRVALSLVFAYLYGAERSALALPRVGMLRRGQCVAQTGRATSLSRWTTSDSTGAQLSGVVDGPRVAGTVRIGDVVASRFDYSGVDSRVPDAAALPPTGYANMLRAGTPATPVTVPGAETLAATRTTSLPPSLPTLAQHTLQQR